jgi:ferredoxin-NADP reductase
MLAAAVAQVADLRREPQPLRALLESARRWAIPRVDRASAALRADLPWLERVLSAVDPVLSLNTVRARVVEVRDETADVKSYVLAPNAHFGSFRPGAYVSVRVVIDGQVHTRSYSLSAPPSADGLITITVKRVPGGRVSNWLADTIAVGAVLELSAAQGQFLLPEPTPAKMLMISAGSGITPLMSMLRWLVTSGASSEIVFMHFAQSPADVIFQRELTELAARHPCLRVVLCVERPDAEWSSAAGRFSLPLLEQAAPDFRVYDTFLCGPSGFMQAVMQTLERAEADLSKLRFERFNSEFNAADFLEQSQVVRFTRTGAESISNRAATILQQAESLGVRIDSSCRAGHCGTCRCVKKRGVVVDVTTGRASGAGEEFIYPCVSLARGSVELDL